MLMAHNDLVSRYLNGRVLCSDEDTPRLVAKRLNLEETSLCAFNRQEYPNLMPSSKLRKGTMLMLPVQYDLLDRTRTARDRGDDQEDMEEAGLDFEGDEGGPEQESDLVVEDDSVYGKDAIKKGDGSWAGGNASKADMVGSSHTVLRKRHAGDRGALRFGHMAVLEGAEKDALGARVVINCLDARHLGTVWGYRKSSNDYLVKLDVAVGALGEILEAGEVYSPIPCEHVMILDRSFDVERAEDERIHSCMKRILTEEESRTVLALNPWQLILTEKAPHVNCVMAELIDDQEASEQEDDEERGDNAAAGWGRRSFGRGRLVPDDVGTCSVPVDDELLTFYPRLKYEGSGRLLDMIPRYGFKSAVDAEDRKTSNGYITDPRSHELYEMIRAGADGVCMQSVNDRCANREGLDEEWEQEQAWLWYEIRQSLYKERMQQLQSGKLSLTGLENSVEQHLQYHVKDSKNSTAKKHRLTAVLDRAAQGLDRSNLIKLSFSLLKSALAMDSESEGRPSSAGGASLEEQRAGLARQFLGLFVGQSTADRAVDAASTRPHLEATHAPLTQSFNARQVPGAASSFKASTTGVEDKQISSAAGAKHLADTDWKEYTTPQGRKYYHNAVTKTTQWELPPGWSESVCAENPQACKSRDSNTELCDGVASMDAAMRIS